VGDRLQGVDSKYGEMSEWLKEHAWKAVCWSSAETYRITFFAVVSRTNSWVVSLRVSP